MNADNSNKKDDMALQQAHRGMAAVAGPATGESYSCEGSDEEGGWGGNSGYAIQVRWHQWCNGDDNNSRATVFISSAVRSPSVQCVLRRCACVCSVLARFGTVGADHCAYCSVGSS